MTKKKSNIKANEIIEFWRDEVGPEFWYAQSDEVDGKIHARYKELRDQAANGELEEWLETEEGSLALIILLDQFSRNLYRGDKESFRADAYARDLARKALAAGYDRAFDPSLRQFFYLPFCHSEDITEQNWLLENAEEAELFGNLADFHAHRDIIERFGRFPFRNEALGRESTDEEMEFMNEGGYPNLRQKWILKLAN